MMVQQSHTRVNILEGRRLAGLNVDKVVINFAGLASSNQEVKKGTIERHLSFSGKLGLSISAP